MEEWKIYKLGNLVRRKIGYGIVQPGENVLDGIPIVKVNNIIAQTCNVDMLDKTSHENSTKYSRTILNGGELLISVVGSPGKCMIAPSCYKGANLVRAVALIDIQEPLTTKWVYYYLSTSEAQRYMELRLNTTVQATLNIKDLVEMPIPIPSQKIQTSIVSILSSLDAKIELNRRINDNLEQQAQALFKAWFVAFEPFRGGEFIDSELGMIPKGWRVGTLSDIIETLSGFAFRSNTFEPEGKYKLITIKAVQDGYLELNGADCINDVPANMPTHCFLDKKDILLSLTGNVGRCCLVNNDSLLLNQRVAKIKPKILRDWAYTYILFRLSETKIYLETISRGTAQANLSPIEMANMPMIIPTREVMDAFSECTTPLLNNSVVLTIESDKLAQQRDTLLPRLMSGELKINDLNS